LLVAMSLLITSRVLAHTNVENTLIRRVFLSSIHGVKLIGQKCPLEALIRSFRYVLDNNVHKRNYNRDK